VSHPSDVLLIVRAVLTWLYSQDAAGREQLDQNSAELTATLSQMARLEQAKGVLAYRHGVSMTNASLELQRHSAQHQTTLADAAQSVITQARRDTP